MQIINFIKQIIVSYLSKINFYDVFLDFEPSTACLYVICIALLFLLVMFLDKMPKYFIKIFKNLKFNIFNTLFSDKFKSCIKLWI